MKYYRKKSYARKRRYCRRRTKRRYRSRKPKSKRMHFYTREFSTTFTAQGLQAGVPTVTPMAYFFKLSDVVNSGEFTSLYDQYKITRVNCRFVPRSTSQNLSTNGRGYFMSVIDLDDASIGSVTIDALNQYQTKRETSMTSVHSRTLYPAMSAPLYQAGAAFAYGPKKGWVDSAYPDVQHYGLKFLVYNPNPDAIIYNVTVKFYLSMRNVR